MRPSRASTSACGEEAGPGQGGADHQAQEARRRRPQSSTDSKHLGVPGSKMDLLGTRPGVRGQQLQPQAQARWTPGRAGTHRAQTQGARSEDEKAQETQDGTAEEEHLLARGQRGLATAGEGHRPAGGQQTRGAGGRADGASAEPTGPQQVRAGNASAAVSDLRAECRPLSGESAGHGGILRFPSTAHRPQATTERGLGNKPSAGEKGTRPGLPGAQTHSRTRSRRSPRLARTCE